jgi:hypothetical protein
MFELYIKIEEMENIDLNKRISEFFKSEHYVINQNHNIPNIYDIFTKKNEGCLSLRFENNNIYVYYLGKCGIYNGKYLLKKLEDLAMSMPNIQYIELKDESTIYINEYGINLAFLKILTKGQSWYNSLGYFSSNYENEKSYNQRLCNIPLIDILNLCKDKLIDNIAETYNNTTLKNYTDIISKEKKNIEERIKTLKSKLNEHFRDIENNLTTKDYLNKIIELIDDNDYEKTELLNELIETIGVLILYDQKLYKHNNSDFDKKGGKNKHKNKTKKNAKKIKKNKRQSKKYV